jgi:hypothetical protein
MSLPVQPPPSKTRPEGNNTGLARKKRVALIAVAATVVLILVALAALLFLPTSPNPSATPSSAPAAPAPAPTPEKPLPPAPAVTYYKQAGPPAGSPLQGVDPLQVSVSADKVGTSLSDGVVGLSLEATDLADPSLRGDNAEMVALLKGLGKPLVRFGGSSVDRRMFWTSTGERIPSNMTGDKPRPVRAVTPADLQRVNTLLEAADATIGLTVDLGHYDPARAADMAKYASEIFKARLVSITVGNEPNGFPTSGVRPSKWGLNEFGGELQAYAKAIHDVAPNVPLLGPGAYAESWWQPFVDTATPQQKILSLHHYPLTSCDAKDPLSAPTMGNLLSAKMHDRTIAYQREALKVAQPAGLQVWIPETGISACDGANPTSRTHASALWSVDYVLASAQNGIKRLGFHSSLLTCKGGPPLSPICANGAYLQPDGTMTERAPYFGLSMASTLGTGDFLKLNQSGGGLTYSYAVQHADGSTSVVIVNENDPQVNAQVDVTLNLPARPLTGTMTQLSGPSYDAQDSTTIDSKQGPPTPLAGRATVEGFNYGSKTQTFKLTAGTATVLNFTY